jgi:ABC-type nitrate/sulfonate/bicarbonate transport system substrate-binding protein
VFNTIQCFLNEEIGENCSNKVQLFEGRNEKRCASRGEVGEMKCRVSPFVLALTAVLAGTFYPGSVNAQERLRIAWAGGALSAPIWIVQEKGLMKKQGVNAEIIRVGASTMALQAMLAGELDVIGTSVTTLVTSRLAGADVVMILAIVPTFPAHIVTSKTVTDVKQLKGKIGGIGRPGTTTEIVCVSPWVDWASIPMSM